MTDLDLIEQQYGRVSAYDGRSVFRTNLGVFDIRDSARRLKVNTADVADTMPMFEPVKRGRRSAAVAEDLDGSDSEVSRPDDSDTRV
jgi:hypothetical protein